MSIFVTSGSDVTSSTDMEEVEGVPDGQESQVDCSPEDVVSMTLKRENSLRHSQNKGR